ncbi:MAG: DUF367 domain-containing protein [Candidatus Thermoplasmatota archaeon]|jgi:pre-rRNA-processing protein TSR3|nr:DUF367 domain-containing protein [Candidatus Poseidoniia archaeon]MDP6533864.1 DUF367 domain-containing protein [Candidatus Poseidoniia archaeon]MDP6835109.1 DUF367 domain-containing protein [Candidatus Poseidoniia archaeon]MEC8878034.1 DUF367 domain-containing protein [Candidatus Thermoplasmatota archaeon]MEC8948973.1 DUF367 domain-containing protein [Candidatus Thermoplasmatota archaeon]|tara:strand:- start:8477 stop:8935 length:459 start_codon:yes stop_codon:yes gene_type:complete
MSIELRVLELGQDDPRKCTARRLARMRLAYSYDSPTRLPPRGIALDPFAERELTEADSELAQVGGIIGVDCSWNHASETFAKLRLHGLEPRRLPPLVPVNPVNAGKVGKLTTAEALAGALATIGEDEHAAQLMGAFKWGPAFLELNFGTEVL